MSCVNFVEIYNEHKNLVYNLALQYCQNSQDAEEVVQDTFITVYEKWHNFKGESKLSTWIYRITINKSLDFIKSKGRQKRGPAMYAVSLDDDIPSAAAVNFNHPGVQLESKEEVGLIFAAIDKLSDNQRTVIILLKIENRSQSDTAEIMALSPKAVDSLYQRAKKNLKNFLIKVEET